MRSRHSMIAIAVLAVHLLALWALQSGLLRRAVEVVVPVHVLSEFIEPPAPKVAPPPPPPAVPPPMPAVKQPLPKTPVAPPAPQPLAIADPAPAPQALTGITVPQPPAVVQPPVNAAVSNQAPAFPAPAAPPPAAPPPKLELPSTNADYLQNPKPIYPGISKRLNEQGKVLVRVLVGIDGKAQEVKLQQSSGFDRLDQSALQSVAAWRFVPGKRGGTPEAMWHVVPISFVLD